MKCRCDASTVVSLLRQRQVDDIAPLSCVSVVAHDGAAVRSLVAGRDISAGQRGDTSYLAPMDTVVGATFGCARLSR